jgi:hypothetical protein
VHQVCHGNQRISHSQKEFCSFVSCNSFVVVWNSPSRAELRTRIDDLSEAEEYVVFVSVCSGERCALAIFFNSFQSFIIFYVKFSTLWPFFDVNVKQCFLQCKTCR